MSAAANLQPIRNSVIANNSNEPFHVHCTNGGKAYSILLTPRDRISFSNFLRVEEGAPLPKSIKDFRVIYKDELLAHYQGISPESYVALTVDRELRAKVRVYDELPPEKPEDKRTPEEIRAHIEAAAGLICLRLREMLTKSGNIFDAKTYLNPNGCDSFICYNNFESAYEEFRLTPNQFPLAYARAVELYKARYN